MAKGEPHSRPPAGPAACGVATATTQGRRPRAGSVAARFPHVWTRGPLRPPGHVQGRLLLSGGPAWGSCSGRCHPASPETSRKAAPACGSRRHPMQWQRDTVTVTLWSPSARGQAARSSRTRAACRLHAPERPCLTPARRRGQPRIADTRLCAHAFTPTPAAAALTPFSPGSAEEGGPARRCARAGAKLSPALPREACGACRRPAGRPRLPRPHWGQRDRPGATQHPTRPRCRQRASRRPRQADAPLSGKGPVSDLDVAPALPAGRLCPRPLEPASPPMPRPVGKRAAPGHAVRFLPLSAASPLRPPG